MKKHKQKTKLRIIPSIIIALILALVVFYITKNALSSVITLVISAVLLVIYFLAREKLKERSRVAKMEAAFPDFLQLMASNLRAGITIDKALLLSSRKEFAPLDAEINQLGKELVTGKQIDQALKEMAERINSESIKKVNSLIISGIRSGGDIAILLEQTAINMRERNFVEKKSASNVLMYVIFIFFAIAIGSPVLFSLSAVLVEVLTSILSNLPSLESSVTLPFTLTKITISVDFITYFTLIFLIMTDILGSLVIGLVRKGEEKEGVKFVIPLIAISIIIFFAVKSILLSYFTGLIG